MIYMQRLVHSNEYNVKTWTQQHINRINTCNTSHKQCSLVTQTLVMSPVKINHFHKHSYNTFTGTE